MSTFKAKLWGETILDIEVESRKDADAISTAMRQVQGHYFLFGTVVGAIVFGLLPVTALVTLT